MIPHYNLFPSGYPGQFFPPYPPMPLPSVFYPPSFYPAYFPHQDSDPTRPRQDRGLPPWTSQHHPNRHYSFFQDPTANAMPRPGEFYTGEEDYYREKYRSRGDRGIEIERIRRNRSNSEERKANKRRRSNSFERRGDNSESFDRRRDRSYSRERDRRNRSYSREKGRFRDLRRDRSYSRDRDFKEEKYSRERQRDFKEERYSRERSKDRNVDTRDVRKGEDRQTQDQKNQSNKPEEFNINKKLSVNVDRSSSQKAMPSPIVVVSSPESISTSTSKHSTIIPQELSNPNSTLRSLTTFPNPKPTLSKVDNKSDTLSYPVSKRISANTVLRSDSRSRDPPKPKQSKVANISQSPYKKNPPKSLSTVSKSSISPAKPAASNPSKPQSKAFLQDPPLSNFNFSPTTNLPKAKPLNKSLEKKLLDYKSLLEFGEEFLSMSNLKYKYHQVPSTHILQILHKPSDAVLGEGRSSRLDKAKMQALFRVLAGYNTGVLDRWLDKHCHTLSF